MSRRRDHRSWAWLLLAGAGWLAGCTGVEDASARVPATSILPLAGYPDGGMPRVKPMKPDGGMILPDAAAPAPAPKQPKSGGNEPEEGTRLVSIR